MYGAVYGDIAGSYYKNKFFNSNNPSHRISEITDETVMIASVCKLLNQGVDQNQDILTGNARAIEYAQYYKKFYYQYFDAGFDQGMASWARAVRMKKQNAQSSICAARVAPIAYAYKDIDQVEYQARLSCMYTHSNKNSLAASEAVAGAVFLALNGYSKENIILYAEKKLSTSLLLSFDSIKRSPTPDARVSRTVPNAFMAFLNSDTYEETIYRAVSLGGDTDTIASMAGAIAEAYYGGVSESITQKFKKFIPQELISIFDKFYD